MDCLYTKTVAFDFCFVWEKSDLKNIIFTCWVLCLLHMWIWNQEYRASSLHSAPNMQQRWSHAFL